MHNNQERLVGTMYILDGEQSDGGEEHEAEVSRPGGPEDRGGHGQDGEAPHLDASHKHCSIQLQGPGSIS